MAGWLKRRARARLPLRGHAEDPRREGLGGSAAPGSVWPLGSDVIRACCTPMIHVPSLSSTQWNSSSSPTTLPPNIAAQKALSIETSAASNTMTCRISSIPKNGSGIGARFHRQTLLSIIKMATLFGGGGMNAERGTGDRQNTRTPVAIDPHRGGVPWTHRSATYHGTIRSALISRLPGAVKRRSRATEIPNGGFATTRNGRRGSRRSAPSALTTVTWELPNSFRR